MKSPLILPYVVMTDGREEEKVAIIVVILLEPWNSLRKVTFIVCFFVLYNRHWFNRVCVGFLFLRTRGRAPYKTASACANRAAYPDPPPIVPHPESVVGSGQALGYSPGLLQNPIL